jgi:hypothetical protein
MRLPRSLIFIKHSTEHLTSPFPMVCRNIREKFIPRQCFGGQVTQLEKDIVKM